MILQDNISQSKLWGLISEGLSCSVHTYDMWSIKWSLQSCFLDPESGAKSLDKNVSLLLISTKKNQAYFLEMNKETLIPLKINHMKIIHGDSSLHLTISIIIYNDICASIIHASTCMQGVYDHTVHTWWGSFLPPWCCSCCPSCMEVPAVQPRSRGQGAASRTFCSYGWNVKDGNIMKS